MDMHQGAYGRICLCDRVGRVDDSAAFDRERTLAALRREVIRAHHSSQSSLHGEEKHCATADKTSVDRVDVEHGIASGHV